MSDGRIGRAAGFFLLVLFSGLSSAAGAGDGVAALQTADPACPDDSGDIYVDCGNGTVTDNRTGLVWLKEANCLRDAPTGGVVDWYTAMEFVAGLSDKPMGSAAAGHDCGLSDGSSPGEWRLPSMDEWEAMIVDATALGCAPKITDNQGTGCWIDDPLVCALQGRTCSFVEVSGIYWTSTTWAHTPVIAGLVHLFASGATSGPKNGTFSVWPVRGGQ